MHFDGDMPEHWSSGVYRERGGRGLRPILGHWVRLGDALQDPDMASLVSNNLIFGEDRFLTEMITEEVRVRELTRSVYPYIIPPGEAIWGPILIGHELVTHAPAGIYIEEPHMLTVGYSGSGKSTLQANLALQTMRQGISTQIIDLVGEYPKLLDGKADFNVLTKDSLRLNFLDPEHLNPVYKLLYFADVLSDDMGLLLGSKGFLITELDRLYRIYDVYKGGGGPPPNIPDLASLIASDGKRLRGREAEYSQVVLNRLSAATKAFSRMFECSVGMDLNELVMGNNIIVLNDLSYEYQTLFINLFVMQLNLDRLSRLFKDEAPEPLAIFIDECSRIFDVGLEHRLYQTSISTQAWLLMTVRKCNIRYFLSAPKPSLLLSTVRSETFNKVMFALRDERDLIAMSKSMFLTSEQIQFCKGLERGECVVKLGRYTEPFLIRTPRKVG